MAPRTITLLLPRSSVPVPTLRLPRSTGEAKSRWSETRPVLPVIVSDRPAGNAAALPIANEQARAVSRFLFSSAFEVERDNQGRVVLPAAVRDWAGLGTEAVIVGAGERVDIWAPDRWAAKGFASPDEFAAALNGLGL